MEEGTIVHVEYDLYNADSGDLIETTREDVAKNTTCIRKAAATLR
jgi:FKBP-type peptidyl-prolyl cis-trans isomerase 2